MCTSTIHINKQKFIFENLEYEKEIQIMEKLINKLKNMLNETKRKV